jgi:hypothetical protein
VNKLWIDNRGIVVLFPVEATDLFLSPKRENRVRGCALSNSMYRRVILWELKRPGRAVEHLSPSFVEVKKAWS